MDFPGGEIRGQIAAKRQRLKQSERARVGGCYFFVRPQSKRLEVVFFVGRSIKSPLIHVASRTSKVRLAHMVRIVHRDQVEPPLTEWLREAYDHQDAPKPAAAPKARHKRKTSR